MIDKLSRFVPFRLRRAALGAIHGYTFPRALHRISALAPKELPSRDLLKQLRSGWGNEDWSGRTDYLEQVVKWAAMTQGPILECGSGLTTILLGLFAGQRGIPVWSLEHSIEWHERMTKTLRKHRIPGVELCFTPVRDYGGFSWYDPPLDRMPPSFRMVVCDGPPERSTPGGRYGLLPVMRDRLGSGTVVLLDDVNLDAEQAVLARWLSERSASKKIWRDEPSHFFALVVLD